MKLIDKIGDIGGLYIVLGVAYTRQGGVTPPLLKPPLDHAQVYASQAKRRMEIIHPRGDYTPISNILCFKNFHLM